MDIPQEVVTKPIHKKKKCKKAKWLSEEDLQIAAKRSKSKGERERYTHLNAEFQNIARRNKKAFSSEQCKEIKENQRMGKTRDLFKKIGDTKGTFHAEIGTIKDKNGKDITEVEENKRTSRGRRIREGAYMSRWCSGDTAQQNNWECLGNSRRA